MGQAGSEPQPTFDCTVQIVEHPHGIQQGCKKCRTVLLTGNFAIGLTLKEGETTKKYLLGGPPQEHCGEMKAFFLVFDTLDVAEAEKTWVESYLTEHKTTEGLCLIDWIIPTNN